MLAASGVPRASTLRDLDSINTLRESTSIPSTSAPLDTDIDAYVNGLQAKSSAELFQEYMAQTKRDFDTFVEDRYGMDQQEQRKRIYEHFGLSKVEERFGTPDAGSSSRTGGGGFGRSSRRPELNGGSQASPHRQSLGAQSMSRSVLGKSVGRGSLRGSLFSDVAERTNASPAPTSSEDPSLRNKQEKYATKVKELNLSRLEGRVYPVVEQFARVEMEPGEDVSLPLTFSKSC